MCLCVHPSCIHSSSLLLVARNVHLKTYVNHVLQNVYLSWLYSTVHTGKYQQAILLYKFPLKIRGNRPTGYATLFSMSTVQVPTGTCTMHYRTCGCFLVFSVREQKLVQYVFRKLCEDDFLPQGQH